MAAPRKHPPSNALEDIERLAGKGYSTEGLAKHFGVSRATIKRWFDDEKLQDAYAFGRDSYRQYLEEQIVSLTLAGKTPVGFLYLLKSKFQMYDVPQSGTKVDVALKTQPVQVLVVRDHGTDEEWARACEAQQRKLLADAAGPHTIPARLPKPQDAPVGSPSQGLCATEAPVTATVEPPARFPWSPVPQNASETSWQPVIEALPTPAPALARIPILAPVWKTGA